MNNAPRRFPLSPAELHLICGAVALLSCLLILFPEISPEGEEETTAQYAGYALAGACVFSAVVMGLQAFILMMRLRNGRTLIYLFQWLGIWAAYTGLFMFIAVLADVEPPQEADTAPAIQTTDTLHTPNETLSGPDALVIDINPEEQSADAVADTPNLRRLEEEHSELLKAYLDASPRWSGRENDDTFYSKPGHLVLQPPVTTGAPGLVHVNFRRLVGGDPLPSGYTVVKAGDPFPEKAAQGSDLAVDLGRDLYLLAAWRGADHAETAHKAINAALTTIDERLQSLISKPDENTIRLMLAGRRSYPGQQPELRLSEPPSQEGTYQAEIYANTGEAGTLLLYIRDTESGKTLKLLSCPANYSADKNELFRHDIPGSTPDWARLAETQEGRNILPDKAPLFIIRLGSAHQYFGAAFEVWFRPADTRKKTTLILRRCYRVQPFEVTDRAAPEKATAAEEPPSEGELPPTEQEAPAAPESENDTPAELPAPAADTADAPEMPAEATPEAPEQTEDTSC